MNGTALLPRDAVPLASAIDAMQKFAAQHDDALADEATERWGAVQSLVPEHMLVVAKVRHRYEGQKFLPGQVYWMADARVAANEERGIVLRSGQAPCDYWGAPGRILGAEDVDGVTPYATAPSQGALKILAGVGYDPGSAAFRLHAAVNEHTKHSMAFVRWGDTNPHCSTRQYDGVTDLSIARDAFLQADILHCHVGYIAVNNLGIAPTDQQMLVRHYHGSRPNGGTHMEPKFDIAKNARVFGARLVLVEEGRQLGMDIEWSPIPMPVARYRTLRDVVRAREGFVPLQGAATTARPLLIGHSPTNTEYKGTSVLRRTVERLQARGVPVELRLIAGVSLREALERKACCDVFFDSFWLGIQGSGLEAGAMEIPVVAGDRHAARLYKEAIGYVPYAFADTGEELESCLALLAMNAVYREQVGAVTTQYVQDIHDYRAVAHRYEQSLARWTGRHDITTEVHS